jgi:hypothetical protein
MAHCINRETAARKPYRHDPCLKRQHPNDIGSPRTYRRPYGVDAQISFSYLHALLIVIFLSKTEEVTLIRRFPITPVKGAGRPFSIFQN